MASLCRPLGLPLSPVEHSDAPPSRLTIGWVKSNEACPCLHPSVASRLTVPSLLGSSLKEASCSLTPDAREATYSFRLSSAREKGFYAVKTLSAIHNGTLCGTLAFAPPGDGKKRGVRTSFRCAATEAPEEAGAFERDLYSRISGFHFAGKGSFSSDFSTPGPARPGFAASENTVSPYGFFSPESQPATFPDFPDSTDVPFDDFDSQFSSPNASPLSTVAGFPPSISARADDPFLKNPLKRQLRMGCGWLAMIVELDGVVLEEDADLERRAWAALAEEESRPQPLAMALKRADGMKSEQAISEVLCWTRDPIRMRRLAQRKEVLLEQMKSGIYTIREGTREFLQVLRKYSVPVALVSHRPRSFVDAALEALDLRGDFSVVVTAEDVQRSKPDPEMYQYASQLMEVIPERCIVVGCSHSSIEGAHDAWMKCVVLLGKHRAYELSSADLVVPRLDHLSVVDLKNLADTEQPEYGPPELEMEREEEAKPAQQPSAAVADMW